MDGSIALTVFFDYLPQDFKHDFGEFMKGEDLLILGPGKDFFEATEFARRFPGIRRIVVMDNDLKNIKGYTEELVKLPDDMRNRVIIARDDIREHTLFGPAAFKAAYCNMVMNVEILDQDLRRAFENIHTVLRDGGYCMGIMDDPAPECIDGQIGRASVGKECRSRWSPYH